MVAALFLSKYASCTAPRQNKVSMQTAAVSQLSKQRDLSELSLCLRFAPMHIAGVANMTARLMQLCMLAFTQHKQNSGLIDMMILRSTCAGG